MAGWVVIELVLFDGVGFYRVRALWRGAVGGSVQGVVPFTGFPWRVFAGLAGLLVFLASASRVKQQHRGLLLDAPVSTSRN